MRDRLPPELRDMVYNELLIGEALEDMRKLMYSVLAVDDKESPAQKTKKPAKREQSPWAKKRVRYISLRTQPLFRATYVGGPRFLIPGLIDSEVIHEIIFHYYKTGKYLALALPKQCDTFLRHDFYGAGIVAADVALPHLEFQYRQCSQYWERSKHCHSMKLRMPGPDTYTSILEHAYVWKDSAKFTLSITVQHANETDQSPFRGYMRYAHGVQGVAEGSSRSRRQDNVCSSHYRTRWNRTEYKVEKHIESFQAGRGEDLFSAQRKEVLDVIGYIRADIWRRWVDGVKAYNKEQNERKLKLKSTIETQGGDLIAGSG